MYTGYTWLRRDMVNRVRHFRAPVLSSAGNSSRGATNWPIQRNTLARNYMIAFSWTETDGKGSNGINLRDAGGGGGVGTHYVKFRNL